MLRGPRPISRMTVAFAFTLGTAICCTNCVDSPSAFIPAISIEQQDEESSELGGIIIDVNNDQPDSNANDSPPADDDFTEEPPAQPDADGPTIPPSPVDPPSQSGDPPGSAEETPDIAANDLPEFCDAQLEWDSAWSVYEDEVLALINQHRAAGADCGNEGSFSSVPPLTKHPALRCAARNHSMDMFERDYFSHTSPDGASPRDRIDQSGYTASTWGENIAWGYPTPPAVVAGWMNSPGHCANIMNAAFTEIGVGYFDGAIWTQTFARP